MGLRLMRGGCRWKTDSGADKIKMQGDGIIIGAEKND